MSRPSLDELWKSASPGGRTFRPDHVSALPEAARRYLEHAIVPGTLLASAVRLRMHGEIKLRRWLPFVAEQVIHWGRGMIWKAAIGKDGSIRGFDRLIDGEGAMRWKLFGIIPMRGASGLDITRSAAGRLMAESVWLPSVLCGNEVLWTAQDSFHPHARLSVQDETEDLSLTIDEWGRLTAISLPRWGNPGGKVFYYANFGGVVDEESTFGGYTIPTRLRVGWHFGTDRFKAEGEFFRATVDDASYR